MKYVALLRGINVGGNNIIKMVALRQCFEADGFVNVATYIQSGNVIFESGENDIRKLERRIESAVARTFQCDARVIARSSAQLKKVVSDVPPDWNRRMDLRCNIAFLKGPATSEQALKQIQPTDGVDFVASGKGVVYIATTLKDLKRSGLPKIVGTAIYQQMTVRNYNTTKKILALMGRTGLAT